MIGSVRVVCYDPVMTERLRIEFEGQTVVVESAMSSAIIGFTAEATIFDEGHPTFISPGDLYLARGRNTGWHLGTCREILQPHGWVLGTPDSGYVPVETGECHKVVEFVES